MDATRVADLLEEIADLLELQDENPFKTRAYINAARTLRAHQDRDLAELVRSGDLARLPGFGKAITEKVTTLIETDRLPYLEELRASVPPGVLELVRIPGLGPKKARLLVEHLHVRTAGELEYACNENRLLHLDRFGAKSQEKILHSIRTMSRHAGRYLLGDALIMAEGIVAALGRDRTIDRAVIAGDLRRGLETVTGIDLVVSALSPTRALDAASSSPLLKNVSADATGQLSGALDNGLPVRLRVVSDDRFGPALLHATGGPGHLAALERRSCARGLEMTADGVTRGGELLACPDEEAVYALLEVPYIPPELRDEGGEVEAALSGSLPHLVEASDLRGILHVHSTWSDGRLSIEAILKRCVELGYEYVGITDHSQSARYARGLTPGSLASQQEEIDAVLPRHPKIKVFKGSEVDILPDGRLDYPEEILERLDFVVASVHSSFGLPREEQTRRIVRAIRNRRTTILGHPTGRLLLAREPYDVDLDEVMRTAAGEGVYLELNANPRRLDLDADACRRGRAAGACFAIDPDAHDAAGLEHLRYGLAVARRAGLQPDDILNTLPAERVEEALKRRL